MRGTVSASWDSENDVGSMDLIKRVVLLTGSSANIIGKSCKTILPSRKVKLKLSSDVDTTEKILQSVGQLCLTPPSEYILATSSGDFRARVTER
jgi:hypothetical protein